MRISEVGRFLPRRVTSLYSHKDGSRRESDPSLQLARRGIFRAATLGGALPH